MVCDLPAVCREENAIDKIPREEIMCIIQKSPTGYRMIFNMDVFDGFSHNLYVGHVRSLTFRYNYSHHTKIGHNLKSRASENFIYYNRIMDEESGYSSRLIDLSNGGFTIIMGNLLMQGPDAENNTLIGYGKEGLSNDSSRLYIVNNTMVNKRVASCNFVDIQIGTAVAEVYNNIFTGIGTPIKGNATATGGNIIDPVIANLDFVDEPNYNYNINSLSPAIDSGVMPDSVNGYSLVPDKSYVHPLGHEERFLVNGVIDAGGYEYTSLTSIPFDTHYPVVVFPNPAIGRVIINFSAETISSIKLYNLSGQLVSSGNQTNQLDISSLTAGWYILNIKLSQGKEHTQVVVKL
jgi:hypothetical protein